MHNKEQKNTKRVTSGTTHSVEFITAVGPLFDAQVLDFRPALICLQEVDQDQYEGFFRKELVSSPLILLRAVRQAQENLLRGRKGF